MITPIVTASFAWFIVAGILFFNPLIAKKYAKDEAHPSVKVLPPSPSTIGKILVAILIQSCLWFLIYKWMQPILSEDWVERGVTFGFVICIMKIIPRDIDRILLTTYPIKRMTIEFIIGLICAFAVSFPFAYFS